MAHVLMVLQISPVNVQLVLLRAHPWEAVKVRNTHAANAQHRLLLMKQSVNKT